MCAPWSIQLLCEDDGLPQEASDRFVQLAKNDPSPVVRLYLASALQRVEKYQTWGIAGELVKHSEDAGDHNIPKMIWFGIEPSIPKDPLRAVPTCAVE